MSLKDKAWRSVYRSGDNNLLTEFYNPALAEAVSYDRAVGFFSSETLILNLQGISQLVRNDGYMRLIIGHPLSVEEFQAVKLGYELNGLYENLFKQLNEVIERSKENRVNRLEVLSWLIAAGKLEIKFAIRRRGMYHEKIGIIKDSDKNQVVFQGSANETVYAIEEGYNAESIMVFPSWNEEIFASYGLPCIDGFERLWKDQQPNTVTIDVPSKFYEKIVAELKPTIEPSINFEMADNEAYKEFFSVFETHHYPKIPDYLGSNKFELFEHQKEAIKAWSRNNKRGILKLATGSGKTITSIYAATRLYEALKKKNGKLILIVAVPYQELAKQWVIVLAQFNIIPIKCWDSKASWNTVLRKEILSFKMGAIDFVGIVAVNRTLVSNEFRNILESVDGHQVMIIGDECHNHGAENTNKLLPNVSSRMGLSATPFRGDDDEFDSPFPNEARTRILNYYGSIIHEYDLGNAIHDRILCEYDYKIIPVHLTDDEQELFEELSGEIAKLVIIQQSHGLNKEQKSKFTTLCGKRSRLLGSARNKLVELEKLLSQVSPDRKSLSLFYCGEGTPDPNFLGIDEYHEKTIHSVSRILHKMGWTSSRFTSEESSQQRNVIMQNFKSKDIDALVSIRVLDEGVDVPACDKAFILASTRNHRQYVQRRGRVLRKSPGKESAKIFDFVVLPSYGSDASASKKLIESELERVDDFCILATNKLEIETDIQKLGLRENYDG